MSINLQYLSDLHLEKRTEMPFELKASCPTLCLLGDIGDFRKQSYHTFLTDACSKFKNVLLVLGNHEHYNGFTLFNTQDFKTLLSKHSNLYLLDNKTVYIDTNHNITFTPNLFAPFLCLIGSTLWSDLKEDTTKDFERIPGFNTETYNKLHKIDYDYIHFQLQLNESFPCITLTHHAPHPDLDLIKGENLHAYSSRLKNCYPFKNWVAALSGHTHCNVSKRIKDRYYSSNCLGYPDETPKGKPFDPEMILNICLPTLEQQ